MPTTVKKRSVVVAGHRTSVSLERAFWEAFREIAQDRNVTINQLVSEIDSTRSGNLSSAIRVFILERARAGELKGHSMATESRAMPSADEAA